jgi:hypothetical protein
MVEPQFAELDVFSRGIAWAKHDGHGCAVDRRGRTVPSIACSDKVPPRPWTQESLVQR